MLVQDYEKALCCFDHCVKIRSYIYETSVDMLLKPLIQISQIYKFLLRPEKCFETIEKILGLCEKILNGSADKEKQF